MSGAVRREREGEVAVLVIDNPPVNATSQGVRAGLLAGIRDAAAEPAVRALVLIGAGSTFVAGADLREFGRPLTEPQLPEVIAALEDFPGPVVAALHGGAFGGGLELALGCDARVAAPGTRVGLPEVTLGIIPGAGGTQRLPRLTGVPEAIGLICRGTRLDAGQALRLGIIDAIVAGDLRQDAVARARAMQAKRRVRDLPVPPSEPASVEAAAAAARRAGRDRPAVRAAIAAVVAAQSLPIGAGLAQERSAFRELRDSREARALRHLFFAEREAARVPGLDGIRPGDVASVAVIGAGTMGAGIAIAALDAGWPVTLVEQDAAALARGVARIREHFDGRVARGALDRAGADAAIAGLAGTLDLGAIGNADLVIEAAFEDPQVKHTLFARIDAVAQPGAVLASNTSYLDIDAIAAATSRPADVLGLHFFSPANVMKLLEVVRGRATSARALATALAVGRRMGKVSVVAGNAFGFIGNRIYSAYRRQCEFLVEEGALPQDVDAALEGFGMAMGPFAVGDLSGLDIGWRIRRMQAPARDPSHRYVAIPDRLCEAGRFGRKTGAGYYLYEGGQRVPDPAVEAIIAAERAAKGIVPRRIEAGEIVDRAILAMMNEAALVLAEGVAMRASDIDVVFANGYGFPRWEGGPAFRAAEMGEAALAAGLDRLERASGPGFVRGDAARLAPGREPGGPVSGR